MKLNRMICPTCNHETLTDAAYARCDACGVTFYASQSKGVVLPNPHRHGQHHLANNRAVLCRLNLPHHPRNP